MHLLRSPSLVTALALAALPTLALAGRPPLSDGGLTRPAALESGAPLVLALGGSDPCEGNNYANESHVDGASMGGPLVGLEWIPAVDANVTRVEVFTGEGSASTNFISIWSDDGGAPSQPLAALGVSGPFDVDAAKTWYGADLDVAVPVTAGVTYWVVWDPAGGEQCACSSDPGDIQQTYWGSNTGDVTGGADWFGPFSFADRRWKFRMFCEGGGGGGDSDGDGVPDEEDLCPDTLLPDAVPTEGLLVNHWADLDGDGVFDTVEPEGVGPQAEFSFADTAGCSCEQIIEQLGIGEGHEKHGCSLGVMRRWVSLVSP